MLVTCRAVAVEFFFFFFLFFLEFKCVKKGETKRESNRKIREKSNTTCKWNVLTLKVKGTFELATVKRMKELCKCHSSLLFSLGMDSWSLKC